MSWETQPFGFQVGFCTTESARILVCSLYADDFTVNGETVQTTAIGGASGYRPPGIDQAGFTGGVTIGGLSPGSDTPLTVTHKGQTLSGTIRTLPESGDFSILVTTCDAVQLAGDYVGAYPAMRAEYESSPLTVVGLGFPDDDLYSENIAIYDSGTTGHSVSNTALGGGGEYARALAYLNKFGLFGGGTFQQKATQNPDYLWLLRNVPWWIQQGDHTYVNNAGWWDSTNSLISPRAAVDEPLYAEGRACWLAFNDKIAPPFMRSLDQSCEAWGFSIAGEVFVFSNDRIRWANGHRDNTDGLATDTTGVSMGDNQIDDTLAACAGPEPFKLMLSTSCMGMVTAMPAASVVSAGFTSAQQPLAEDMVKEYRRLITAPNTGLQALAAARGFQFAIVTGDYHVPSVVQFERAVVGQVTESFVEIRPGAVRNSTRPIDPQGVGWETGTISNARSTLWRWADTGNPAMIPAIGHFVKFDFYNSQSPKTRVARLIDKGGVTKWRGRWIEGVGNLPAQTVGKIA